MRLIKPLSVLTLAVALLVLGAVATQAQEVKPFTPMQHAFGDAIQTLTYEEIDQILLETQAYALKHPDATEADLDRLTMRLVFEYTRKPLPRTADPDSKIYNPLPDSVQRLSSLEKRLCIISPSKCAKMYNCSKKASRTAPDYFSSGCEDGKCDAFRHAYWNALMVRNIDLEFARNFAAAHETGVPGNLGTLAFDMDVFNNGWGQSIGQNHSTSRYTDTQVEKVVETYVKTGKLVIIKNGRIVRSNQ